MFNIELKYNLKDIKQFIENNLENWILIVMNEAEEE